MEKFKGLTYAEVVKKEQELPKQVEISIYKEKDWPLETFLALIGRSGNENMGTNRLV